jgi:hypothetical protein
LWNATPAVLAAEFESIEQKSPSNAQSAVVPLSSFEPQTLSTLHAP